MLRQNINVTATIALNDDGFESVKFTVDPSTKARGSPSLCFVVDDEPGICHFICATLDDLGIDAASFRNVSQLFEGLSRRSPDLIFLDVSLERSDAVEAIRGLSERNFGGVIQLISGLDQALLADVRRVGEERSLRMSAPLRKPFGVDAVRAIVGEHRLDNSSRAAPSADPPVGPSVTLADALRQNWVEFWYQPKIELKGKRLLGVEALARIRRPDGVVLMPGQFLPQADDAALMALTESAMTTAARDGAALSEAGFHLQIAVNVPASALLKLPIPAIVREYGSQSASRQDFILEVTEDQIIDNLSHAFEVAIQLKNSWHQAVVGRHRTRLLLAREAEGAAVRRTEDRTQLRRRLRSRQGQFRAVQNRRRIGASFRMRRRRRGN